MAEESLVTMWASMASWFTPTSLFLFLNLMIGTIALSAKFTSQKNQPQHPRDNNNNNNNNPTQQQQLFRPASLLERVKSVNFSLYRSGSSDSSTIFQQYSEVVEQTQYSNSEVAEQTQYSNSEVVEQTQYSNSAEQTQYSNSEVVERTQYSSSNSDQAPTQQLARVPSLIDRVKSFKFSFNGYHQSDEVNETQYPNMNLGSDSDSDSDSYTDNPSVRAELASYREEAKMEKSVREKPPSSGQAPTKMEKSVSEKVETKSKSVQAPVKMMMRSVSEKLRFWRAEEDENVERRRPATVRGGFETVSSGDGDGDEQECVNEKADDFINRFRNQLKLQRLDSMIRYKDMITRGSSR